MTAGAAAAVAVNALVRVVLGLPINLLSMPGDTPIPAVNQIARDAYSRQNQLYYQARPPESASVVVMIGGQLHGARARFRS